MKKKQKQRLVSALVSGALLLAGSTVFADEQEFSLDEYVVTANRMPVKKTETAASVTVITREEIARSGAANVPDIFKKTNVMMSEDATASIPSINGDDRVLILIDGRKLNQEGGQRMGRFGADLYYLPSVDSIERIEIVKGPASALYGSDAVGGVINIITRKGSKPDTHYTLETGSWGLRRYNLNTENKVGDFSYRINFERKHQDDYRYKNSRSGEVERAVNTAVDQDSLNIRLDKDLGNNRSVTLTVDHIDGRKGFNVIPDQTVQPYYYFPNGVKAYVENDVSLTYRWEQGEKTDNFIKLYRNYLTYNYENMTNLYGIDVNWGRFTNQTDGAEWQQTWKFSDNYTLLGGASWRQTTYDNSEQGISDKKITNRAGFLENHWRLPQNWSVTAGVRYDSYSLFGNKSTTRITVNREINNTTNVFASWGQVFKVPFIDEVYGNGIVVPNLNLRPETGDVITLGMNARLAKETELQASVFTSRVEDAITYQNLGTTAFPVYQYANVAEQKRSGLDLSLKRQLSPQWQIAAGYSYVKVEEKEHGAGSYQDDINNSQPNGYRLSLQYGQDKWNADLSLRGATGRNLKAFSSEDYWVVDLGVNYKINPDTRAYLKVYNLANEAYELRGSYKTSDITGAYPMPARQFVFGIDQRI
ncbi:MAG TPA: TonB-dependent receptor [Methylomusa anaerophila]|uniref:Vitamin B12 transporter BtuB n=1 Tax=Methylomusa anaerophila TaxID=1930071 RepID=A0A348AM39_9FIRM|nr:TonB-dependent receptor [Methylomusa anaerophila]BBB92137.1 vitamin B12 transporter BtuB precursor [Methylomusa anaerophila]HML87849.1 TonB-dependent receptor [Methylomusa anaerophila]